MGRPGDPLARRALTPAELEETRAQMEAAGRRQSLNWGLVIGGALGFVAACLLYKVGLLSVLVSGHPAP